MAVFLFIFMSNEDDNRPALPTDGNHNPVQGGVSSADGTTPTPAEVNPATGGLLVDVVNESGAVPDTQLAGQKVVSDTGTPEPLAADTSCTYVLLQAKTSNTSNCFVGNDDDQEVELEPGQAWAFAIDNLNKVYVKVGTNNDGVNYTAGAIAQ